MKNPHTDKAYLFIRERILSGLYRPARRLRTVALAKEIGVSRTPVRDGLRQLEIEGLVEIRARLGASVRQVDIVEYKELCEVRLALESLAAELAARNCNYGELAEIQSAFEAMVRLVNAVAEQPDSFRLYQQLVQEDIRFHFAVLEAAHNKVMKQEIVRLHLLNRIVSVGVLKDAGAESPENPEGEWPGRQAVDPIKGAEAWTGLGVERRQLILDSHRKIFYAIKDRQPDAARMAMHEHIAETIERVSLAMAKLNRKLELPLLTRDQMRLSPYG